MKLTNEMAAKIKATRKEMSLTQEQFARKLDISTPTLIGIERGQRFFIRNSTWSKVFDGVVLSDVPQKKAPAAPAPSTVAQSLTYEEKQAVVKAVKILLGLAEIRQTLYPPLRNTRPRESVSGDPQ